ncbi:MAG: hypothetical protein AB7F32_04020 [Victivallaceae bacterium]
MKRPFYDIMHSRGAAPIWRGLLAPFGVALLAALVLLPAPGCRAAAPEATPPPSVEAMSQANSADFDAFAKLCGPELLEAVQERNYRKFVARFSSAFDSKEREKSFPALCLRIGKIIKSEYIGHLNREVLQTYLWKVTVERTEKAGNGETRMATFDRLLQITLVKVDGKFQIVEFQFN